MKTLGRILILLAVFAIVMGATYAVVHAGGTSSSGMPQFENGTRPPLPDGNMQRRPDGGERGGWMFGLIKNVGIVAVVVTVIALPKTMKRNRKRAMPVMAE
jgi:hypothetical protein